MSTIATAEVVLVLRSLGVTAELTDDPDAFELGDGERVRVLERPTPSLAGIQALVAQHTWLGTALIPADPEAPDVLSAHES